MTSFSGAVGKRPPRNLNIELLRIVAMFLVVACHMTIHVDFTNRTFQDQLPSSPGWGSAFRHLIMQYGQVGVSIFFMISGFFLVAKSFSWRRVLSSWLQMFLYTALCLLCAVIFSHFFLLPFGMNQLLSGKEAISTTLWSLIPFLYNSYWFMDAYILMLLISPYINLIFKHMSDKQIIFLMALLAFIGAWPLLLSRPNHWNNVTYALLCYVLGAFLSKHRKQLRYTSNALILVLISGSTILMLAFNKFALSGSTWAQRLTWSNQVHQGLQVLPILIAACLFVITLKSPKLQVGETANKVILKASSATFGVYLLHEDIFGFRFIWGEASTHLPPVSGLWGKLGIGLLTCAVTFIILDLVSALLDSLLVHPATQFILRKSKLA